MKIKVYKLNFGTDKLGDIILYTVKFKKHWWNKWKYIIDSETRVPALFHDKKTAVEIANMAQEEISFNEMTLLKNQKY